MCNLNRSPSFEHWFRKNHPEHEIRSAGTYYGYPTQVNEECLEWADKIYTMDLEQEMFIAEKYPKYINKVKTIGISDDYDPDSPQIIRLIEYWSRKHC